MSDIIEAVEEEIKPNEKEEEDLVSVERVIAWGERACAGEYSGDPDDYEDVGETKPVEDSTGESDPTSGVIVDFNDTRRSNEDKGRLLDWVESKLGFFVDEAPVESEYISPDQETTFKVFAKEFATPQNPWQFSKWQNEGELPSILLQGKKMYEFQEEMGYEEVK